MATSSKHYTRSSKYRDSQKENKLPPIGSVNNHRTRPEKFHSIAPHADLRLKHSSKNIWLPQINQPNKLVSLKTIPVLSNSDIQKESKHLEVIKLRGVLHQSFSVLPPIKSNKHEEELPVKHRNHRKHSYHDICIDKIDDANNATNNNNISSKNAKKYIANTNNKQCPDDNISNDHNVVRKKTDKKRRHGIDSKATSSYDCNNNNDENDEKYDDGKCEEEEEEEDIYIKIIQSLNGFVIEKDQDDVLITKMPEFPQDIDAKSKKNKNGTEDKMTNQMVKWMRYRGRRLAICYEMDELYKDLASVIKHNLLVKHLEEIWMC